MADELAGVRWILSSPLADVLRVGHDAGVLISPNPDADAISIFALVGHTAHSNHAHLDDRESVRKQVTRFAWPALGLVDGVAEGRPGVGSRRTSRR
jgi:hypothetical protein